MLLLHSLIDSIASSDRLLLVLVFGFRFGMASLDPNENNMKSCRAKYGAEEMCTDLWNWASKNPYGYAGSPDKSN